MGPDRRSFPVGATRGAPGGVAGPLVGRDEPATAPEGPAPEDLLPLAISQPAEALERATALVDASSDPRALSYAHQAAMIVHRDRGSTDEALAHGREALREATRVDDARRADVLATLGVTLGYAGRTTEALRRFEEARPLTPPDGVPRLMVRRAHVMHLLARDAEAAVDLDVAIDGFHRAGDALWEGRALNNRCDVLLARGRTRLAEADAVRAEQVLTSIGQDYEAAQAVHNRALAAHQRGDLPTALTLLDQAAARYEALGNVRHDLFVDRVQTLLTAGLTAEARAVGARALAATDLAPVRRAELLLVLAQAALASADLDAAEAHADAAAALFEEQLRRAWVDRARLLGVRARFVRTDEDQLPWLLDHPAAARQVIRESSDVDLSALVGEAEALVASMRAHGARELPVALLMHGRIAHAAGHVEAGRRSLEEAAAGRRSGPPLSRAAAWLASAVLARHDADRRRLWDACRHGLDAVDEHRNLLGDLELRALASGHGLQLAALAVTEAVESGRARDLYWWTERWRAAALREPVSRPDDPALRRDLAALRTVARRLDASEDGPHAVALARERSRLEAQIRAAYRHERAAGGGSSSAAGLDLDRVLAALGDDGVLVTLAHDRSTLHRVVVGRGRVRRDVVGPFAASAREAEFARFALRRAAYGRPVDLPATAAALERTLLGAGRPWWRDAARVVVVPPADLLTAPWGLLPSWSDAVLTVSPSVTQWVRAREAAAAASPVRRAEGRVALVTGPGLTTREAEVAELAPLHVTPRVLRGDDATVGAALEALDGASFAHVAAHGVFRTEAPLFSSLQLADGPLTVHDLRDLHRAPAALVLSACDSGGAAPIGTFEALGLVSSLLAMGSRTLLAAVVPVNDAACLPVMADVHEVVASGGGVAEGWLAARRRAADDPLHAATAASFTAWGA